MLALTKTASVLCMEIPIILLNKLKKKAQEEMKDDCADHFADITVLVH